MAEENSNNKIIIYKTENGQTKIEVQLKNESVWLSLNQMAELFDTDKSGISRHIDNIFESGELDPNATVAKNATVQNEGSRKVEREIEYYNLDMIISVGYRVNSIRGTHFRIWATKQLREYIVKGFVMDDERLENGGYRHGYFQELLEIVKKELAKFNS